MAESHTQEVVVRIPCEKIQPNRYQPRRHFDQVKLKELGESIREQGLQQPVVVRPLNGAQNGNGIYELVIGERRWRAVSGVLQEDTIPAIIRELTDEQAHEIALIENIQREDLTPIEEAHSLQSLVEYYQGNVTQAAQRLGKGKSPQWVSKRIAFLTLPSEVQQFLDDSKLNTAQAEVILDIEIDHQIQAAREAVQLNLNANQLRGRKQHHLKKNPGEAARVVDSVKFTNVQGSLVRVYEIVNKFDFVMLRDEGKRTILKRQIELVQRALALASEKLNESVNEESESNEGQHKLQ